MKNAPSRDTIILWSAVIAGIGLLALLVRHAAIYKFGTDAFTGNVLFVVIFILLVGLYLGFQSVIEDFSVNMVALKNDVRQEENTPILIIISVNSTMMKHRWRICIMNGMNSSPSISRKNLI